MPELRADVTGSVWKINCAVGDTVTAGETVLIVESMKMEIPVDATRGGTVAEIRCEEGQAIREGDVVIVLT